MQLKKGEIMSPQTNKKDRKIDVSELRSTVNLGPLADCVGYYLKQAQEYDFALFMEATPDPNVTPARFAALMIIDNNPGLTQANLAKILGVARSGVTTMLKSLHALGYVTQDVADDDKRTIRLSITHAAKLSLKEITKDMLANDRVLTSNLTSEERDQLKILLAKLLPVSALRG